MLLRSWSFTWAPTLSSRLSLKWSLEKRCQPITAHAFTSLSFKFSVKYIHRVVCSSMRVGGDPMPLAPPAAGFRPQPVGRTCVAPSSRPWARAGASGRGRGGMRHRTPSSFPARIEDVPHLSPAPPYSVSRPHPRVGGERGYTVGRVGGEGAGSCPPIRIEDVLPPRPGRSVRSGSGSVSESIRFRFRFGSGSVPESVRAVLFLFFNGAGEDIARAFDRSNMLKSNHSL